MGRKSAASRARRGAVSKGTGPARDFGPSIRLASGKGAPDGAAADPRRTVVKEFRPDPDAPDGRLVRGGRVRDPLRRMFEAGQISKAQWDAVEAFRDDMDLAHGARPARGEEALVRGPAFGRTWPSEAQLDAWRRVARTMLAFNDQEARLLRWTVIQYRPLTAFVRQETMRNETGGRLLQQVLDRLSERHRPRSERR